MTRAALVILFAAASGACHTFTPVSVDEVSPGQTVRARVTGAFSDSLSAMLGRPDARVVEGTVVERSGPATLLDVAVDQQLEGMDFQTLNQRVEIPDAAFVDVEVRELDRTRTLLVAGGAVAVAGAVVIRQLIQDTGGGETPGGGGGPSDAVVSFDVLQVPLHAIGWFLGR